MRTMNDKVFLKVFDEKGVIVSTTPSGVKFIGNYDSLVKSEAIADGPDGIKSGDTIYVRGVSVKSVWAKCTYRLADGTLGVLAPKEEVVLVDPKSIPSTLCSRPPPTPTPSDGKVYTP